VKGGGAKRKGLRAYSRTANAGGTRKIRIGCSWQGEWIASDFVLVTVACSNGALVLGQWPPTGKAIGDARKGRGGAAERNAGEGKPEQEGIVEPAAGGVPSLAKKMGDSEHCHSATAWDVPSPAKPVLSLWLLLCLLQDQPAHDGPDHPGKNIVAARVAAAAVARQTHPTIGHPPSTLDYRPPTRGRERAAPVSTTATAATRLFACASCCCLSCSGSSSQGARPCGHRPLTC